MNEWREVALPDLFDVQIGGTPARGAMQYWAEEDDWSSIPWVSIADMHHNRIVTDTKEKITQQGLNSSNAKIVPKGTLFFSFKLTIGRLAFAGIDLATNEAIAALIPKKQTVEPLLIYYVLPTILDHIIYDTAVKGKTLNKQKISKISFFLPTSLSEQRKIARILSTVDAVIEKTEAAIAKYKAIKAGLMRDLLACGIDLATSKLRPGYEVAPELYKESELGWVPREWEVDTLGNSTDYVDFRGKTPPKSEFGVFLVTARNIKDGFIDYEYSKEYIPEHVYETAMLRGKAEIGDVVITTEAPMGNVAQIDRAHIALAQRVIKYRGKSSKLRNDFLAIYLMSDGFRRRMISESTGSTVLGIKGSRLHKLLVSMPRKDEQDAISEMIKAHEAIIEVEDTYLQKVTKLKQALMSDLLTGKVRVKYEDEIAEAISWQK